MKGGGQARVAGRRSQPPHAATAAVSGRRLSTVAIRGDGSGFGPAQAMGRRPQAAGRKSDSGLGRPTTPPAVAWPVAVIASGRSTGQAERAATLTLCWLLGTVPALGRWWWAVSRFRRSQVEAKWDVGSDSATTHLDSAVGIPPAGSHGASGCVVVSAGVHRKASAAAYLSILHMHHA